ncbi:MAG: hypothetical protein VX436_04400 [Planctomycetota bacterium]|nr:hypothetical protein [Planctomycetota bacterium]
MLHPDKPIQSDQILAIVVGAHLQAEVGDRAIANRARDVITQWMENNESNNPPWPLVCSDLWYLNQIELKTQPTICIGRPELNAATAALSPKLPTAILKDGSFRIQLDPEYIKCTCCMWGVDNAHSKLALDVFITDCLDGFLGSIFGIRVEK